MSAEKEFLNELVKARLLLETGVPGVFGRGQVFEQVLGNLIGRPSAPMAAIGGSDN